MNNLHPRGRSAKRTSASMYDGRLDMRHLGSRNHNNHNFGGDTNLYLSQDPAAQREIDRLIAEFEHERQQEEHELAVVQNWLALCRGGQMPSGDQMGNIGTVPGMNNPQIPGAQQPPAAAADQPPAPLLLDKRMFDDETFSLLWDLLQANALEDENDFKEIQELEARLRHCYEEQGLEFPAELSAANVPFVKGPEITVVGHNPGGSHQDGSQQPPKKKAKRPATPGRSRENPETKQSAIGQEPSPPDAPSKKASDTLTTGDKVGGDREAQTGGGRRQQTPGPKRKAGQSNGSTKPTKTPGKTTPKLRDPSRSGDSVTPQKAGSGQKRGRATAALASPRCVTRAIKLRKCCVLENCGDCRDNDVFYRSLINSGRNFVQL